jgi:hypothetical protein
MEIGAALGGRVVVLSTLQDGRAAWKSYGRAGITRGRGQSAGAHSAQQAGLRLEDVSRPSLDQVAGRDRLDAKIRRAVT